MKGFAKLGANPNPILDEGSPTTWGGIEDAAYLCDTLEIILNLDPPLGNLSLGWGTDFINAKPIMASWIFTVIDLDNNPTFFIFHLVEGSSPLLLGPDVKYFTNTLNLLNEKCIIIKSPSDTGQRCFSTYIFPDVTHGSGNKRLRIAIAMQANANEKLLMSDLQLKSQHSPLLFSNQIHLFTHARPLEVKSICAEAIILTEKLEDAFEQVEGACDACVLNGRALPSKKTPLTQVNEAFNKEIQVDFKYCEFREKRHTPFFITETSTSYTETLIVQNKEMYTIVEKLEAIWICAHGAPRNFSADDDYYRRKLINFLRVHDNKFKPRPAPRHNKIGILVRKNGTLKDIIRKLGTDITTAQPDTSFARATFLSNMFSGSRLMSSFEQARGYSPSILGLPRTYVTQELLEEHKAQVATRALQRLLQSYAPDSPTPEMLVILNDDVWAFYQTSKQNEKFQWVKAKVVKAEQHHLIARRSQRGPPIRVAYEDVRIAPQVEIAQELMSCSVDHEFGYDGPTDGGVSDIQESGQDPCTPSLMGYTSEKMPKSPQDDIARYAETVHEEAPDVTTILKSDKASILDEIHDVVGSHQVSGNKLAFAPPWIINQAFEKERKEN